MAIETINLDCPQCGETFERLLKEVTRSRSKSRLSFCSALCGYQHKIKGMIESICLGCGSLIVKKDLVTYRDKKYCSRNCASKNSVTDHRRQTARETFMQHRQTSTVEGAAHILRKREGPKYVNFRNSLPFTSDIEYVIDEYVFDVIIPDHNLLVEFDGPYHHGQQLETDKAKDMAAENKNFKVLRFQVESGCDIPVQFADRVVDYVRRLEGQNRTRREFNSLHLHLSTFGVDGYQTTLEF